MTSLPAFRRSRLLNAGLIALVIAIGLPTRLIPEIFPAFVVDYLGDALWALAIFLLIGLVLPQKSTRTIFLIALAVTWGIEFSELHQADWINALRAYKLGGLILGYTFLPSDLLMYLCGIGAGVVLEIRFLARSAPNVSSRPEGRMKSLWKKDWFRTLTIVALIVSACGLVAIPTTYFMFLPFMGIAGGNSCPEWLPFTVEEWGRFHLPPSFSNLQTFCGGMQGWIARAEFDMSPADVDALVDGSLIERPLTRQLDPDDPLYNHPEIRRMTSYLFGRAKNGWQWALIDTSDPTVYHVYFSAVGGN